MTFIIISAILLMNVNVAFNVCYRSMPQASAAVNVDLVISVCRRPTQMGASHVTAWD